MPAHHTKDKGDLGVAKAHADLVGKGWTVLFPATEHAPFDLVAYRDGQSLRMQVKFRTVCRGALLVQFRSVWADRHGTRVKPVDKSAVDVVCIYCPQTDECYHLNPSDHGQSVSLRVNPGRNDQVAGVLHAAEFRDVPSQLDEAIR